jgi:hypothetical protein
VNYLPRLVSNCNPPDLYLLIARITDVSHWCPARINLWYFSWKGKVNFFFFFSVLGMHWGCSGPEHDRQAFYH